MVTSPSVKIGYVILSHRDWEQVARQAQVLHQLDPSATVVVSHDQRDIEGVQRISQVDGVTVQARTGGRADFSAIERWFDAVEALETLGGVDFVLLLSGQDHLVAHPDVIKEELVASGDGWMEYFDVADPQQVPWGTREGVSRYQYAWRFLFPLSGANAWRLHGIHAANRVQPWWRLNVAYGGLRVGMRVGPPPAPLRTVYGGSQWHALSWRAAQSVAATMRTRKDIVDWGRRSLVSDESFIQTVVLNDPKLSVQRGARRYFDFSGTHFGHPKTLDLSDLTAVVASKSWFARKVDWHVSRELIDALDERLGIKPADRR